MDLKVYLNSVEYRATDRYTIREQAGQTATSSFDLKMDDNDLPLTHTRVECYYKGALFYTGLIVSVDSPTYSTKFETDIVSIQVASMDTVFTRRLVSEVWENKYIHEIVEDIFANYLEEEGFTLGTIDLFTTLYEEYTVSNLTAESVLTELGNAVGAVASIDKDLKFNFLSATSFTEVEAPTSISKLKITESGTSLKTSQKLAGASDETSIQTKVLTWVTGQDQIALGYQVAAKPNVTINSVAVSVGAIGADEEDPSFTFLWAYGNNSIVVNTTATVQPVADDIVSVIYKGYYDIEIETVNEALQSEIASLSGTSGKIETIVVDSSITSITDGETYCNNLLAVKGERERVVNLNCKGVENTELLNSWDLNYPELNIDGQFVITERTITNFYGDVFKVTLKLKNRGYYTRYGTIYDAHSNEIIKLISSSTDSVFKNSYVYDNVLFTDEIEADEYFMQLTCGTTDLMNPAWFAGATVGV